jgi:hypothetical protein
MNPVGVVSAAAAIGLDSILIRPRRMFGPFVAQVTFEEVHDDELEITEHPVEQGAAITDHAYKKPARLRIRCAWSNSPSSPGLISGVVGGLVAGQQAAVQSFLGGNSVSAVRDVYSKLLKLQADRVPFRATTGKRVYENMLVKSLSVTTDPATENSLVVVATFQQIIRVSTSTISVAAPSINQTSPELTQPVISSGTKSLTASKKFDPVGGGRGFVNPPRVVQ